MAPIAMNCESEGCQFATKEYEPSVAVELLRFHREDKHPRAVGGQATEDTRRKAKFPQPEIDQGQPLEVWETFLTQWEEFKRQVHISTDKVPGQLVSCGSKELQTSLH